MELKPNFKQTEIGAIPVDWAVATVFDFADRRKELFDDGDWIEATYLTDRGVRLVQTGNIGQGQFIDKETKKYISAESFAKLRCKELRTGDILICRLAEPAGRSCVLPAMDDERVITAVDVTIFRPPAELADRRFLAGIFSTPQWFRAVSDRCGGSTRTRISRGELGRITVQLPPLLEQCAIAAVLSDVDALLGGLNRLIAKKRDLKQAAMQQLLAGQTRLPGFGDAWEEKQLGELAEIVSGGTPKTSEPAYWNGGIKWCTPTDITGCPGKYLIDTERSISQLGLNSSGARLLPAGALLLCSRATIGELKIASGQVCTNQGFKSLICHSGVSNEFLYYKLATMKAQMVERAFGSTFLEISKANVAALEISTPALSEQVAIATVLSDMDVELSALEARRDKTRALKQAMMQALLTGRIRLV